MTEQNEIKPTKVAIYGDSIEAELAPAKTSSIKASFGAAALLLGIGMVAGLYTSSVSTSGPSARAVNLAEDDNFDNSTDLCGLRMGKAIQYFPGHAYVLTFGRTKYTAVDMFCPSYEGVWPNNTVCQTDMIPVQSNYQSGTYTATSMGSQGGKVLQLHATDGHVFDSTWTVPIFATGEDFSIASDYTPFFPYGASTYKIYSRESGECNHVEKFFEASAQVIEWDDSKRGPYTQFQAGAPAPIFEIVEGLDGYDASAAPSKLENGVLIWNDRAYTYKDVGAALRDKINVVQSKHHDQKLGRVIKVQASCATQLYVFAETEDPRGGWSSSTLVSAGFEELTSQSEYNVHPEGYGAFYFRTFRKQLEAQTEFVLPAVEQTDWIGAIGLSAECTPSFDS